MVFCGRAAFALSHKGRGDLRRRQQARGWRRTEMSPISAAMTDTPLKAAAPKIGFVSLGCPKALVDSERIITKLRAEGYELSPSYEGADAVVVNTCGFLNSAKEESLAAIGEALAENGRVIVTGCLGVEADRIRAAYPDVLAITGPHQYEAVVAEVHKAVPRPHDPFLDLVPPQGVRLTPRHYAYVKISEGCNNACSFCIIPTLRGRLESRPPRRCDARGGAARRRRRAGASRHLARHQRLRPRSRLRQERLARTGPRDALPQPCRGARLARRLGAPPLRLSLSPCRSGLAADGGGAGAALSRHSLPACQPEGTEGDAPPGASGEDLGAYRALARDAVPTLPSARPSSWASPARPRKTSSYSSTG